MRTYCPVGGRGRTNILPTVVLAAGFVLIAACNGRGTVCTSELGIEILPRTVSLTVGEQIRSQVRLTTCSGQKVVEDSFVWRSDDPGVLVVDAEGILRGVAPGRTKVEVSGQGNGPLGFIEVAVEANGS